MKRIFSMSCIIAFFVCMLLFPQAAFQGASSGLLLWFQTVLPTLLPFIIISNLLIRTGTVDIIARMLSPFLCKFFCVSPYGAFAVLIGFLCGCPMGGKVTADLLKEGLISEREGRYLLSFCNNTSPMFIISYVIWQNLHSLRLTLPFLIVTVSAPILLSFLFRKIYRIPKDIVKKEKPGRPLFTKPGSGILDICMMDGFETITRIGGYIMLFSICISLAKILPEGNPLFTSIFLPSLELTTGIAMICGAGSSSTVKILSSLTLVSFGGWCAAAQTKAMLQGTNLPFLPYIAEKLATALAASLLTYVCLLFL